MIGRSFGSGAFTGHAPFWSSPAGVLLYRVGSLTFAVNWVDRNGRRSSSGMPDGHYLDLRVSPDGTRVAVGRADPDVSSSGWVWDFARGVWAVLRFRAFRTDFPAWSGNGREVAFTTFLSPGSTISRSSADGSGESETLLKGQERMTVDDWSQDGQFILYSQGTARELTDIWVLPVQPPGTPSRLISGPYSKFSAKFSPVGRFVAFTSNESDRNEVYLQAFKVGPSHVLVISGGRRQISRNGGSKPLWRADGRELFFISSDNKMMAAEIQLAGDTFTPGPVHELFSATFMTLNVLPYGVTPDGQRFLVLEAKDRALHPPFTVAVNWRDGLTN